MCGGGGWGGTPASPAQWGSMGRNWVAVQAWARGMACCPSRPPPRPPLPQKRKWTGDLLRALPWLKKKEVYNLVSDESQIWQCGWPAGCLPPGGAPPALIRLAGAPERATGLGTPP